MSGGPATVDVPEETGREDRGLGTSLVQGIAWTGGLKWGTQVFTWTTTIIVARLLTPADYGLVGMASVYLGLMVVISDFGLSTAVVTLRDLSAAQIRQINTLALFTGVVLVGISFAVAAPLSWFFNAPQLQLVVIVMSAGFVIRALRVVPNALLQKELRFKLIAAIDATQVVIVAFSMVLFAALGFRYWTLVIGNLLGAAVATLLTIARRPTAFGRPRIESLRQVLTFSWHVLVGHISWYLYTKADFVVAGRILGKAPLGAYTFAWDLAGTFPAKITDVVSRVVPGFFSAVQDDAAALRHYLLRLSGGIALFTLPATVGLALVADDFVMLALGEKWIGVIAPLQVLAISASVRSLTPLPSRVLTVTGDTRFLMRLNQIELLLLVPAFYIGGRIWGTVGIAIAWLIVDPLIAVWMLRRVFLRTGLTAGRYLRALWPAINSTVSMALIVGLARFLLPLEWPFGLRLAVQVAMGAATYATTMYLMHRDELAYAVRILKKLRS